MSRSRPGADLEECRVDECRIAANRERYAELMRQWMRRAKDAIARHIHGVSGHVIDAVQEGIGLQRYFLPQEFTEDVVRRTLHDLIPDANRTGVS
jgi:hypothetical protein